MTKSQNLSSRAVVTKDISAPTAVVFAKPQREFDKTVGTLGDLRVVLPLPAVLGRDLDLQGLVLLRHLLQGVLHVGDHLAQLLVLLLQHQGGSQCNHFCLGEAVLSFLKQRSKLLVLGSQDVAVRLQGGHIAMLQLQYWPPLCRSRSLSD